MERSRQSVASEAGDRDRRVAGAGADLEEAHEATGSSRRRSTLGFRGGSVLIIRRGRASCGCFGSRSAIDRTSIMRTSLMAALASGVVAFDGRR